MRAARLLAGGLALAVLGGCGKPAPTLPEGAIPAATLQDGTYRAVLQTPSGELPFGLELAHEGEGDARKPVLTLINGAERVRVTEVRIDRDTLGAQMPGYANRLTATASADGLVGSVSMLRPGGTRVELPLRATRGQTHRFFTDEEAGTEPPVSVAGRWAITFTSGDKTSPGIAELTQSGRTVTGTVLTPTGDQRFIAGEVRGRGLYLSRFDGGTPLVYRATLDDAGQLAGTLQYGSWSQETFTAKRDDQARLPDASTLTHVKDPSAPFAFSFPGLDGKPVALSDPAFKGKVVVVMLGGSWCPNCHDEAEFMVPFYGRYQAKGLAVVQLMFEHFGDLPQATAAAKRFRDQYQLPYPVLIAGISDKQDAATRLPQLDRIFAFPTTLVLDRQGRVRKVHTGFSGKATGAHWEEYQREFTALIEQLLAEPA